MLPSTPSDFQAGSTELSSAPFQRGLVNGLGLLPGSRAPVSNLIVNYNYTLMPMHNLNRFSPYLDGMFVFSYSHEDSYEDHDEIANKFFSSSSKRRRTTNNSVHIAELHGGQQNPLIIGVNLPLLNYLLAKVCLSYNAVSKNNDALTSNLLQRWILPDKKKILNLIYPVGGNVTNPEVRRLKYNDGGPDVRVMCLFGAVEVFDFWSCCPCITSSNKFLRLRPQTDIGFVLRAIEVRHYGDEKNCVLNFSIDNSLNEKLVYDKDVVWKVEPFVFGCTEEFIAKEKEYTLKRHIEVMDGKDVKIDSNNYNKKVLTVEYKPFFWKIGKIGSNTTGGTDSVFDDISVKQDPSVSFHQLIRLPKVTIYMDTLASRSLCN